jgi:hypothetical protein
MPLIQGYVGQQVDPFCSMVCWKLPAWHVFGQVLPQNLGQKAEWSAHDPVAGDIREVCMRKKPITQDAKVLLQLALLQNEADMQAARRWWREAFWPDNASDYLKIELAHGTKQSRWLRQVATYWGMATSLVLDGSLSEKALLDAEFSREMFAVFAKVRPFLNQLRKRTDNPDFMANLERFILRSKAARKRLQLEIQGSAAKRKMRK